MTIRHSMTEDEFIASMKNEIWWPWEAAEFDGPHDEDCFAGDPFAYQWARTFVEQWMDEDGPVEEIWRLYEDGAWDNQVLRPFYRVWQAWKSKNLS
jgi:hypothetical protein